MLDVADPKLTTAQIGASGVLLIQYRLLKLGIESAPMTTDSGVDLVVYSSKQDHALTVQVKACLRPKPAGGKGSMALDWWLPSKNAAQLIGLVNLDRDQAWLFTREEFDAKAQQETDARRHLYMYSDDTHQPRQSNCHVRDFEDFLVERRALDIFGMTKSPP